MSERYMITTGGTGGHMFPAIALAHALTARGYAPFIVTDRRGERYLDDTLERYVVRAASPSGGLLARVRAVIELAIGSLQSWNITRRQRPVAVACFGGYGSFPAAIAARLLRVPMLLHEQNAVFGRANRALSRFAARIALSYENTEELPQGAADTIVTGNPVRPGFAKSDNGQSIHSEIAAESTSADRILVLILGGSQGARILSDALPGALCALKPELRQRLGITQQCRREDLERVRAVYAEHAVPAELSTFFDDVPERMARADLVVTRAGASTVAELTACGRPALLIPYLYAADAHQEANAKRLEEAGAAVMIRQPDVSVEKVASCLEKLLTNPKRLASMAAAMRDMAHPDAAEQLAEAMLALGKRPRRT